MLDAVKKHVENVDPITKNTIAVRVVKNAGAMAMAN